ncbi:glycosyltransferase [Chitinophaga lutea]|uniref:Glycosyltransferase n=1 Tax=Chitinophaga lutea TaxID=2488634 RepID=A0A3N4PQQ7_9BACT|nr:glycosyltransferase [Chitinophaga lutea]RPE10025.1 glycosyltransferase [Chitinophaga lutea]
MKISVVVPTYKRPLLLMECIKALARQRFSKEEFEVLVVSDGPDLLTKKVVVSWKHTGLLDIEYIALADRRGPAAARNAGWKVASGQLIAFTDDDCLPDEHWLETLWESAQQHEPCAFAGKVIVPIPPVPTDHEWNAAQLENAGFATANCACMRSVLEKTGGFDERFQMAWREDSDLEFSILEKHIPLEPLPEAIVVHPVRKAPWGVSLYQQKKTMFNALLHKKFPGYYRERIHAEPPFGYYLMIAGFTGSWLFMLAGNFPVAWICLGAWLAALLFFIVKRLWDTSHSSAHVLEMIVTSALIPFLSVYWYWYGTWKFRRSHV